MWLCLDHVVRSYRRSFGVATGHLSRAYSFLKSSSPFTRRGLKCSQAVANLTGRGAAPLVR